MSVLFLILLGCYVSRYLDMIFPDHKFQNNSDLMTLATKLKLHCVAHHLIKGFQCYDNSSGYHVCQVVRNLAN